MSVKKEIKVDGLNDSVSAKRNFDLELLESYANDEKVQAAVDITGIILPVPPGALRYAVSLFEKGESSLKEVNEKSESPLKERMESETRFQMFGMTVLATGALYYAAAAGLITRAGPIGAALVVGVFIGIGIDHLIGDVRDDGRSLSDLISRANAGVPVADPTGHGGTGWRFVRDEN